MKIIPSTFRRPSEEMFQGKMLYDEPLAGHTSFRIGGKADMFFTPADVEDLQRMMRWAGANTIPLLIIGAGTNLLVADSGFRGLVINPRLCLNEVRRDGLMIDAGAGVSLSKLAYELAKLGLSGLEFAAGIPGSVGGALYMNAGAWKRCIGEVVTSAQLIDMRGETHHVPLAEMGLGYRSSGLPLGVICSVVMKMKEGVPDELLAEMKEYEDKRKATQPLEYPSAGCIWRNLKDQQISAGKLVEDAGLKGKQIGDAQISERHANFIINLGKASAAEVLALMVLVESTVYSKFGVQLEREVRLVGQWGELLPSRRSQRV